MSVRETVEAIARAEGYEIIHAEDDPVAIVLSEYHFDPRKGEKQAGIILASRPRFVLHEAMEDADPFSIPEDYLEKLGDDASHELVPLMEAARQTGAMFGGCNIDRKAAVRRRLSEYHPSLEGLFDGEDMSSFVRRMALQGPQSEDDRLLVELYRKMFKDGYMEELDVGMARRISRYGKKGLVVGILGDGHGRSSLFERTMDVPYICLYVSLDHSPGATCG